MGRIVGNGRWDADASPMGAPDLEDMVRRKVADECETCLGRTPKNGEWGIEAGAS